MPQNTDSQLSPLHPPIVLAEAISMHPPLHRAVNETSTRGLGSSERAARMRARPSESPGSIQEVFPSPGGKCDRPKRLAPESTRRMTSPRVQSARWNCQLSLKVRQNFARGTISKFSALAFLAIFAITGCYRASGWDRPELVAIEMPAVGGDRILGNKSMAGAGDYYIGNDFVALAVDGTPASEASGIAGAPGAGSIVDVGYISLDTSYRRIAMPCDMLDRLTTVVNQDPEISLIFDTFKAVNGLGSSRIEMYGKIYDPKHKIPGIASDGKGWDDKGFVLEVDAAASISLTSLDRYFTIKTDITNRRPSPIGIRSIGDFLYQRGGGFRVLAPVNKDKTGQPTSAWGVDMPGTDFSDPLGNSVYSGPVAFMGVEPGAPTVDCHVSLGLLPLDADQFLVATDPQDSLSETRPIFPQRFVAGSLDAGADLAPNASLSHSRRLYVKGGSSGEPDYSGVPITQETPNQATGILNSMVWHAARQKGEKLGMLNVITEGSGTRSSPIASELRFERYIGPEGGDPAKDDDQQNWLLERLEWMEPPETTSSTESYYGSYETPMSRFGVYLPEGTYRVVSKNRLYTTVIQEGTNEGNGDRPNLAAPIKIEPDKMFFLTERVSPERSAVFSDYGSRLKPALAGFMVSTRPSDSVYAAVQPMRFSISGLDGQPSPQQRRYRGITSRWDPIYKLPSPTDYYYGHFHFRGGNGAFGVQMVDSIILWVDPGDPFDPGKPGLYRAYASSGPLQALEEFTIDARPGLGGTSKDLTVFNSPMPAGWHSFDVPGPSMTTSGGMLPGEQLASALAEGVSVVAATELDHQVDGDDLNRMFHADLYYGDDWLVAIGYDPYVFNARSSDLVSEGRSYGRATALFTPFVPGARNGGARPSADWNLADFLCQAQGEYNVVNRPRGRQGLFTQFSPSQPVTPNAPWWSEKGLHSMGKANGQFDAIEILSAGAIAESGIDVWWSEYIDLRADWFSILSQEGRPGSFIKALGFSSGKYSQDTPVGLARTYLFTGEEVVSHTSLAPVLRALQTGAAVASTGPLLEVSVISTKSEDAPSGVGIGGLAQIGAAATVDLEVKLWATDWMPIDEIRVVVNGQPAIAPIPNPKQTFAQSEEDYRCYTKVIQVPIPAGKDAWLVVEAGAPLSTAGPYRPGSPWAIHMKGIYPIAIANPIFLGRTGNGYTPPGL